jgi:hypothetical protein
MVALFMFSMRQSQCQSDGVSINYGDSLCWCLINGIGSIDSIDFLGTRILG